MGRGASLEGVTYVASIYVWVMVFPLVGQSVFDTIDLKCVELQI